ncbi:twin-arginine translocase TatA/TatE family subunit [Paenibacillus sp. MBLB4367]|uniref:twin-arginine translocase TatA/TatE family subunit n=1 Tax=Paenibacillus sp. MBLB4367 TaxID=3384767 RepID=UPI00390804B5
MSIGISGFLMILFIALLLFGPSKLPQLGKAIGATIREFRNGGKDILDDDEKKHL